ncbi:hypothetical protein Bca4012_024465 [Brassica carinata]
MFLGLSSDARYQIINGLESVVEGSTEAKRTPMIAVAFTVVVRFSNNVYGGMQFVDWRPIVKLTRFYYKPVRKPALGVSV